MVWLVKFRIFLLSLVSFCSALLANEVDYVCLKDSQDTSTLRQRPYYSKNSSKKSEPFHVNIGPNYTRAHIKPSGFPSFDGNLGGLQGEVRFQKPDFFYGGLKVAWRYGDVDASNGERSLRDISLQENLGYTFQIIAPGNTLTLFSGFGFRQFRHQVWLDGFSGITLRYDDFYIPLGIYGLFQVNDFFSVGVNGTWMPQVYTSLKIDPLGGARWITKNKLTNIYNEIDFVFTSNQFKFILSPFVELWEDGETSAQSRCGTKLVLPQNSYVFWGLNFNIRYSF